jgi:hypothetical protein
MGYLKPMRWPILLLWKVKTSNLIGCKKYRKNFMDYFFATIKAEN